jgi:hypothetical protein
MSRTHIFDFADLTKTVEPTLKIAAATYASPMLFKWVVGFYEPIELFVVPVFAGRGSHPCIQAYVKHEELHKGVTLLGAKNFPPANRFSYLGLHTTTLLTIFVANA